MIARLHTHKHTPAANGPVAPVDSPLAVKAQCNTVIASLVEWDRIPTFEFLLFHFFLL